MGDFFNTGADILNLEDLVEVGRQYLETYNDPEADPDDKDEAAAVLRELGKVKDDLMGRVNTNETNEDVLDALESYAQDEATLIAADYFTTYAEELAEDIFGYGAEVREALTHWPYRHIDWQAAANELRADYNETEIEGQTYLIRSV